MNRLQLRSLYQLTRIRFLLVWREPEAVFWIFIFPILLAVGLEAVGLALGGRSAGVPTLSTVIDHALGRHGVRFVLFLGWLAVGWAPVAGVVCHRSDRAA